MHCMNVGCVYLCLKAQHKINRSHIIRLLSTPKHIPFACCRPHCYQASLYMIALSFEYHAKYFEFWQMLHSTERKKEHPGDWHHKFNHTTANATALVQCNEKTHTESHRSIIMYIISLQLLNYTDNLLFFYSCVMVCSTENQLLAQSFLVDVICKWNGRIKVMTMMMVMPIITVWWACTLRNHMLW